MARTALFLLAACALVETGVAHAADPAPVRVTVIADLDDDIYDARARRGGVDATRVAVADFGGTVLGRLVAVDALNTIITSLPWRRTWPNRRMTPGPTC